MPVPYAGCGVERRGFSLQSRRRGISRQCQTLVVGWRCGFLMAVLDAGCWGGDGVSHGSPRRWLLGGGGLVLMAIPDTGCGRGETGILMAVPDAGCGGEAGVFHGSLRRWLFGLKTWILMAVLDAGCGWDRQGFSGESQTWLWGRIDWGFHGSSQTLVVGGVEAGVFMAVSDAGCWVWRWCFQGRARNWF